MDEQNAVYPYTALLSIDKRKWSTDTCYNRDQPPKHFAKLKKPDAKDCIANDATYMKLCRKGPSREQVIAGGRWGLGGEQLELPAKGLRNGVFLAGDANFLKRAVTKLCKFTVTLWTGPFKEVKGVIRQLWGHTRIFLERRRNHG